MTHPSARARRIAIVGAGFSGAVTAVQLLRHAPPEGLQVVLINESGRCARGLAYGTSSREHVLNVPAGNMSALAQDADDFLRYCRWSDPQVGPGSFVSRRLYGAYLEALLSAAELTAAPTIALERVVGRVIGLDIDAGAGVAIRMAQGGLIAVDHVWRSATSRRWTRCRRSRWPRPARATCAIPGRAMHCAASRPMQTCCSSAPG
ncbi:FAD/NAD(P)-binding protein [Aquabacterium humicola]|uniref:FAD/NAD(P)-binding protein n=1 Tax=Aquabacterium humicola TaxID=3237377 RepID=UPI00254393A9|nr:FAD/NAD(P)-binding protein [Rubrivivax pictus]